MEGHSTAWRDRPYEWVGDWSARRATLSPDRDALVDWATGERHTYADLDRRANRAARLLVERGVVGGGAVGEAGDDSSGAVGDSAGGRSGDTGDGSGDAGGAAERGAGAGADSRAGERVAVVSRNRVEVFDLFFATGKTGGVLAPLSHRLAPRELAELLELVEPRLLVVEAPFAGRVADALERADVDPEVLELPADDVEDGDVEDDDVENDAEDGHAEADEPATQLAAEPYADALPEEDAPVEPAPVALDDVHLLLHTGGSTGTPKETAVTHGSIAWNSLNTIASWGLRPDDVTPMVFPTFHTGGWNVITVPLLHLGGTVVIDREVEPGRVVEQVEAERATVLVAVPAVLRSIATHDDWDDADLASLRLVKSGGGPARESVVRAWRERGVDLSQGYGLTECGPNNFAMPDEWADEKVASVGKPALHVDARIVDEDGEPVERGEVGELELASPHAAPGYWRNEAETAATFGAGTDGGADGGADGDADGATDGEGSGSAAASGLPWVSTGDLARVDDDGYYHVVGRKKTMFVSGGENVYPPVVEDAVAEHPAVAEVVVVGVPDERWGTVGKAVVEPAGEYDPDADEPPLTLAELESFLEDRLARHEVPASLAFVAELPTSGPEKVDRQAVEAEFGE